MIKEPSQDDIDNAFRGTNFGLPGETPGGRRDLVADCILKHACGFSSGSTITLICKDLGLLTRKGTPRKQAKAWAYIHAHGS